MPNSVNEHHLLAETALNTLNRPPDQAAFIELLASLQHLADMHSLTFNDLLTAARAAVEMLVPGLGIALIEGRFRAHQPLLDR